MQKKLRRSALLGGCAAIMLVGSIPAAAEQRNFDIPAGDAVASIPEFARQAGVQIIAPADDLQRRRTPRIKGELDIHAALRRLIEGTGLEIVSEEGGIVVLRKSAR